jgi:hypothetical protein
MQAKELTAKLEQAGIETGLEINEINQALAKIDAELAKEDKSEEDKPRDVAAASAELEQIQQELK